MTGWSAYGSAERVGKDVPQLSRERNCFDRMYPFGNPHIPSLRSPSGAAETRWVPYVRKVSINQLDSSPWGPPSILPPVMITV